MTPEEEVTFHRVRLLFIAYFWVETSLTAFIMYRQRRHVDLTVGSLHPTLRPYKAIFNYEILHLAAFETKEMAWLQIKFKIFNAAIWSVIIASDLIPLIWETCTFVGTPYDFTPAFLSTEVKTDLCFGFVFALFEIVIIEWPQSFVAQKFARSFGRDCTTTHVSFARRLFHETLMLTMYKAIQTFILSFAVEFFDEHTAGIHTWGRHLSLGVLYAFGSFSLEMMDHVLIHFFGEEGVIAMKDVDPAIRKTVVDPVENVCRDTGFPLSDVVLKMVGEEESSNADCFSVFGFYQVVNVLSSLYEELNERTETWERRRRIRKLKRGGGLNSDEVEGILAHEVGHWYHGHPEQLIIFTHFIVGPIIFVAGLALTESRWLYDVFHFALPKDADPRTYPFLPGLVIVQFIVMKWFDSLFSCFVNIQTCRNEAQADAFTTTVGRGTKMQDGVVKMLADYITYPTSDHIFNIFYDHHPTLVQRIEGIEAAKSRR